MAESKAPAHEGRNRRDLVPFDSRHFEQLAREGQTFGAVEAFEYIRQTRHWAGPESVSGEGASDAQTAVLRAALPSLLRRLRTRTLLDLPCGDYRWMQDVNLPVEHYIGADLLPTLVAENQARHGGPQRRFVVVDLTADVLPSADTLLCRDCLVHLSFSDIARAVANIRRCDIRHLLTTTFPSCGENEDIVTGDWRPINLQRPPFHFPEPLVLLNEGCTEGDGVFVDKSLGVWDVRDVPATLTWPYP